MMNKWRSLFSAILILLPLSGFCAPGNSPVGYWKTIDDVTNQPKSILEITEAKDHSLTGRIVKIYPRPGYDENEVCTECKGERHNQRIVGMVIMEHVKQSVSNQHQWVNGQILDPVNGKTYNCNFTLMDDGKQAVVRGYIGMPLFGRSQTWFRVDSLSSTNPNPIVILPT
jgi:uncharacterized protein (DUF2147 family)